MDKQETFNTVARHLLTQNAKSQVVTPSFDEDYDEPVNKFDCRYRGPDGLKCAIGCLISDEAYEPEIEGIDIIGLCQSKLFSDNKLRYPKIVQCLGVENYTDQVFLSNLQGIHDEFEPPFWQQRLYSFGQDNQLDCSVLKEF